MRSQIATTSSAVIGADWLAADGGQHVFVECAPGGAAILVGFARHCGGEIKLGGFAQHVRFAFRAAIAPGGGHRRDALRDHLRVLLRLRPRDAQRDHPVIADGGERLALAVQRIAEAPDLGAGCHDFDDEAVAVGDAVAGRSRLECANLGFGEGNG